MKTMNIIRTFAAVFAVCALMAASCNNETPDGPDPIVVKPEFPSVVEDNDVAPGETLTLTFQANMDWTVTVPSSGLQWFWIQDNPPRAPALGRNCWCCQFLAILSGNGFARGRKEY